jgi:hypothetical protein
MMISVFSATITEKCGVWCKKEYNMWFGAKESPTCGVTCYFLSLRRIIVCVYVYFCPF